MNAPPCNNNISKKDNILIKICSFPVHLQNRHETDVTDVRLHCRVLLLECLLQVTDSPWFYIHVSGSTISWFFYIESLVLG